MCVNVRGKELASRVGSIFFLVSIVKMRERAFDGSRQGGGGGG
jgi:hypothetical protein